MERAPHGGQVAVAGKGLDSRLLSPSSHEQRCMVVACCCQRGGVVLGAVKCLSRYGGGEGSLKGNGLN